MKRCIQVRPQRTLKGRALAVVVVALVVYGLVAHPAETAQIGQVIGTALARIAEAIFDVLQGL